MPSKPNIALVGPMGSGKSSIGRALAARLNRPFVDLDRLIEDHAGASISLIFEMEGEPGFRRREREMLAERLAGSGAVIACGGGIVLDADNRAALRAQSFVIHLVANVDEQLARLARDRSRPLLQTDDRRARLETLADHRDPLYAEVADLRFYPGDASAACAARELAIQLDAASDTSWTKRND
jgi:shikimate kinase